jgi:hypothetical protein
MTNSLSLYQLSSHYIQALDFLTDPELAIPMQAVNDTLEGLTGELEDKAVNVAKFIRNMETTANAIKTAEVEMAKRRKSLETRVQWLEDYLKSSMEATGITKIECPYFKLSIAKNPPSVELVNEALIPEVFKRVETVVHIDKTAIKAALSSGQTVDGARLVNGTRLAIK